MLIAIHNAKWNAIWKSLASKKFIMDTFRAYNIVWDMGCFYHICKDTFILNDLSTSLKIFLNAIEMSDKLRLILSFDIQDKNGNSVIGNDYNAVRTMMAVTKVTKTDTTALLLWLNTHLPELSKDEITAGLMLPFGHPEQGELLGKTFHESSPPARVYENFHTQTIIEPRYLERCQKDNDEQ